ncbi:MAG: radical SAM protein [Bacteroidales bacterium]
MLFNETIFGPIKSRRLGISLGVNLLPVDGKLCSFDCIYCECGYNKDQGKGTKLPTSIEVKRLLEEKLISLQKEGVTPDVITFAGNGEPTMHPEFPIIIDQTIELRDKYFPQAKISVLSNATLVSRPEVFKALLKVDNNILKLDGAIDHSVNIMDRPNSPSYSVATAVENLMKFQGKFILQTMFLRGVVNGETLDNTTQEELQAWYRVVRQLKPESIMIYSIDRPTPEKNLVKISKEELQEIAAPLQSEGFKIIIA